MVDKSNEYGYVGASPVQADGSNTGIFEANDVLDLINSGQWYSGFVSDELNLIYKYTFTGSESTVDFKSTDIFPDTYDTIYIAGDLAGTSMTAMSWATSVDDLVTVPSHTYSCYKAFGDATGGFTRSYTASDTSVTELTPAISGDLVFGYVVSGLTSHNFTRGINGYCIANNGTTALTRFAGGHCDETLDLNSFRFTISNVDAGSTIKVYSYKAA